METKFDGMTKDEIIEAIAAKLDYLPEEQRIPMVMGAFFTLLQ